MQPSAERKGSHDFDGTIDGAGYKGSMDDPRKFPLFLVPTTIKRWIARVLGKGAKKYALGNWMRGMSYTEIISAVQRHIDAWQDGEDVDPETGENHLAHAACGLAFLSWFIDGPRREEYRRFDDRLAGRTPPVMPPGMAEMTPARRPEFVERFNEPRNVPRPQGIGRRSNCHCYGQAWICERCATLPPNTTAATPAFYEGL